MRIGELSDRVGIPTSTIRYYERTQLIDPPHRTGAGYRDYGAATVDRLSFIRDAQAGGLTLNQIGSILDVRDSGVDFTSAAGYKWLMGDMGLGLMSVRKDRLSSLRRPWHGSGQLARREHFGFPKTLRLSARRSLPLPARVLVPTK